jgi:hypothetical protein
MIEIRLHLKDKELEKIAENIATSGEVSSVYTTDCIVAGLKKFLKDSSTFYENIVNSFDNAIDLEELLEYCDPDFE